jgi:hypothetical protein
MSEHKAPPALRAMTDQVMAEATDLLPHNVSEVRQWLTKADQSEVMERFVLEGMKSLEHPSQALIMLFVALARIAELEDAAD